MLKPDSSVIATVMSFELRLSLIPGQQLNFSTDLSTKISIKSLNCLRREIWNSPCKFCYFSLLLYTEICPPVRRWQGPIFERVLPDKISLRDERNFLGQQQEGIFLRTVSTGPAVDYFEHSSHQCFSFLRNSFEDSFRLSCMNMWRTSQRLHPVLER